MWQGWVNEVLGIWLALAPLVNINNASVRLNNLVMGVIAAVVSAYTPIKISWECWLGLIAGAWLAFSSSFLFFVQGGGYIWSNAICGVLIFTSGLLVLEDSPAEKHADHIIDIDDCSRARGALISKDGIQNSRNKNTLVRSYILHNIHNTNRKEQNHGR